MTKTNPTREYDNRDKDRMIAWLEERAASMAIRIITLQAEVQLLRAVMESSRELDRPERPRYVN